MRHARHHLATLALLLASTPFANAETYIWRLANTEGSGGTFNNWNLAGNYNAGGPGTVNFTAADDLVFGAEATRNVRFNSDATLGTIRFANGLTSFATTATDTNVITIDGITRNGAGVYVESGVVAESGNVGLNSHIRLQGEVTFDNQSAIGLDFGNASNGRGGFEGSGNLTITGGRVILRNATILGGYSNTGTTTVRANGSLQFADGITYTSSPITIESTGSLTGGAAVTSSAVVRLGATTVKSGGRISPGGEGNHPATPATLSFSNLLQFEAGSLTVMDVKIAGADRIVAIDGGSILLGGDLRIRLDAALPLTGQYVLFGGLDANSGNFDSVAVRTGTDGANETQLVDDGTGIWTADHAFQGVTVVFNANTGILGISPIPEPAAGVLALFGVALTLTRRRR